MRALKVSIVLGFLSIAPMTVEAQPQRAPNEPQLLKEVRPSYTPEGRTAGIEGCAVLSANVLTDGTIGEVEVVRSLDRNEYGLDAEAVKAMKLWVFKPVVKDGEPVSINIHVGMCFSLKETTTVSEP